MPVQVLEEYADLQMISLNLLCEIKGIMIYKSRYQIMKQHNNFLWFLCETALKVTFAWHNIELYIPTIRIASIILYSNPFIVSGFKLQPSLKV